MKETKRYGDGRYGDGRYGDGRESSHDVFWNTPLY
jgi:hypothetical protein